MTSSVKKVTLISTDGDEFEIPINVAEQSILIQHAMDDVGDSKIPLTNVNSPTLSRVLEYCQKHAGPEMAEEQGGAANDAGGAEEQGRAANDAGGAEELKKWDAEFLKKDTFEVIFDIILAANYMDIKSLLDLGCQTVADMIKKKSPEEIRSIFNLKNDYTPEEEALVRKENEWAFQED